MTMRAFLAIELSDEVREKLAQLSDVLRQSPVKVSWVKPGNLHITLRFLGDIGAPDVDRLVARLAPQYARRMPFRAKVAGVGAFPDVRKPVVIWAGVDDPEGELAALNAIGEEAAEYIGLEPEKKAHRSHVTLGRLRDPFRGGALTPYLQEAAAFEGGTLLVEAVMLMESRLNPGGSVYTPLRRFLLGRERE
jgi:2'-5' RNA ligase